MYTLIAPKADEYAMEVFMGEWLANVADSIIWHFAPLEIPFTKQSCVFNTTIWTVRSYKRVVYAVGVPAKGCCLGESINSNSTAEHMNADGRAVR